MNILSGEYDKSFEGEMKFSPKFFPTTLIELIFARLIFSILRILAIYAKIKLAKYINHEIFEIAFSAENWSK